MLVEKQSDNAPLKMIKNFSYIVSPKISLKQKAMMFLTAGFMMSFPFNILYYGNQLKFNKEVRIKENNYDTWYVGEAQGILSHTYFQRTFIKEPRKHLFPKIVNRMPNPNGEYKEDRLDQYGPYSGKSYFDGGQYGEYDGLVDMISSNYDKTLTRKTDYQKHKNVFDLADKVLARKKEKHKYFLKVKKK